MANYIGYTFDSDGTHDGRHFLDTVQDVAEFICSDMNDKTVTDMMDITVVTTFGWYLDRVDRTRIDFDELIAAVQELQMAEDEFEDDEDEKPATPEEMKEEAVRRMKVMGILDQTIDQFKAGLKSYSERTPLGGILYWIDNNPEWAEMVAKFERDNDVLVYHATHEVMSFYGDRMEFLSCLYVGKNKSEWEYEFCKDGENEFYIGGYCFNLTYPDCTEFGSSAFRNVSGGLVRQF